MNYSRRDLMPDTSKSYSLEEILNMFYVEMSLRGMMKEAPLKSIRNTLMTALDNEYIKMLNPDGEERMTIKKQGNHFKVVSIEACLINHRDIPKGREDVPRESFGQTFMALGGNSLAPPFNRP